MRLRVFFGSGLLVVLSMAVAAQSVPQQGQGRDTQSTAVPATGVLSGQITLAGTGQPMDGVRVSLSGTELRSSQSALTDDQGQFVFTALPAGTFNVRATLPGYVSGTYGQKAPGKTGTAIVLAAGQQRKDVSFELGKGAVISGRVTDERGRPSIGTPVRVMRWMMQSGERTLSSVGSGTTDDRGIYRVYGLTPGEFVVAAIPRNSSTEVITSGDLQRIEELTARGLAEVNATFVINAPNIEGLARGSDPAIGYAPVFYPGTADVAMAGPLRVGIGEEQLGVDIGLVRVPLTTIAGNVIVPPGENPTNVQVRLLPKDGAATGINQMSARPAQNGTFTFRSVVPGAYTVFATATIAAARAGVQLPAPGTPAQPQRRLWGQTEIFVDGAYPPVVTLSLNEGLTVAGHLVFEGAAPLPQGNQRVRVSMNPLGQPLQSAGLGSMQATAESSGRFVVAGVVPGRYRVSASGTQGWLLKSVIVNGVDVLDFPFIVDSSGPVPDVSLRFGDKNTDLRGKLTDSTGGPAPDYTVVIFPDDPRYWVPYARRMRSTRPSTDGTFAFAGLPPGDYRLAAVTDVESGEWLDPEFLRQLMPASISVRLVDGQPTTQDVRVR